MIASQIVRNFSGAAIVLLLLLYLFDSLHETSAAANCHVRTRSREDARRLLALGAAESSLRWKMLEHLDATIFISLARLLILQSIGRLFNFLFLVLIVSRLRQQLVLPYLLLSMLTAARRVDGSGRSVHGPGPENL